MKPIFTISVHPSLAGVDMGLRVEGCSNDILELAPVGFNFVTVSWTEPVAVDQSGNRFMAEGSQSPGNYFEVGSTTRVTYNFMDNTGNTAQCSFLVTVQCKHIFLLNHLLLASGNVICIKYDLYHFSLQSEKVTYIACTFLPCKSQLFFIEVVHIFVLEIKEQRIN